MSPLLPLFLLLLTGPVVCHENCSHMAIINHLGLTSQKDLFTLGRPVKNITSVLIVQIDFRLEAILDVREIEQTFISYNSIDIAWTNDHISWKKKDFCQVERITIPSELLWKPDFRILEVVDKDKTPSSPYLVVRNNGDVTMKNDQVVMSTCKMNVFKFPFDTQSCNLSIKSFIHSIDEIEIENIGSDETVRDSIEEAMHTQYEWLFQEIKITHTWSKAMEKNQSMIVYTLSMRRRSILYVVNFILPVLFFLVLDFASFLMSALNSDKLGFKITILLAVTVLQLLLNEILPSSSDRIPLIAIFCIGVFWLMKLSLLETIVIMYLLRQDEKRLKTGEKTGVENVLCCVSAQHLAKEASTPVDRGSDVDRLAQELSESVGGGSEQETGYWASRIDRINRVFLLVYSVLTALFLITIFLIWLH
ncbi:5-hydroxytryptamine receptor 3A-like [Eucyclogobius newberryi]|uniref:5-hydroxytryptamine receptor 3A-like n=1 Tax=Eucyclogobius newberryi TaxID=166745 RepID=UPI003B5B2BCA